MDSCHDTDKYESFLFEGCCPVDICEEMSIQVPVVVCAKSKVGDIEFECLGHTIDEKVCSDGGCNRFKIVQKIRIKIPVSFEAECEIGDGKVEYCVGECSPN